MKIRILLVIGCCLLISGCGRGIFEVYNHGKQVDTTSLNQLCNLSDICYPEKSRGKSAIGNIRGEALKEAALSIGARGGLCWRSMQIDCELAHNSAKLDQIFDFNRILMDNHILPPVLVEGRNTVNLDTGASTIRLSDRTYKIVKQAHFVTVAPNWRSYLMMNYIKPEQPDRVLLPKNNAERQLWHNATIQGWQQGIGQANLIYQQNLARLQRDYKGMVLYLSLLAQKIVSKPQVARRDLGITGGGQSMNVKDRVLTITALPALKPNSLTWQPELVDKS